MSAESLLQGLTQALYVLVFVVVAVHAVRRPLRANVDIALLFAATSLIIAQQWITAAIGEMPGRLLGVLTGALLMALPYLLLRLVEDFSDVPRLLMRSAAIGLALSILAFLLIPPPFPLPLTLALVLYFFGLEVYAAVAFVREARRSTGVTRRRMQAVAAGSVFLGLTILLAPFPVLIPPLTTLWTIFSRTFGLASGVCYFLGFAPPSILRRAWQEPELRAFLGRAASLPRLPDTESIVHALEQGAASSLGAPGAAIGLWDSDARALRFLVKDPATGQPTGESFDIPGDQMIAGRSFSSGRAILTTDAARDDPEHADLYRTYASLAMLAAPITAGERRLGVLVIYGARAPIFAEDDLVLAQLLADQAAVILESRALIDEAARVRAREEAARMKDDFLSAAAHDLKTPLTTLIAQAQLLERRARRDPLAPVDLTGVKRLVREARRLNTLVLELLDVSRLEEGSFLGAREPVDLVAVAMAACARQASDRHRCLVDAGEPVVGEYDRGRVVQLAENLIENAVKYSPDGGEVRVKVWGKGEQAHLTVSDRGIGISSADLPHVFDRFYRGSNVDDRRFAGTGLGLYLCRGIVEQHGGRIWATSQPGQGSTFHVVLPLTVETQTVETVEAASH
ncbi:MAG: GAF domain-containing sensor histidine kinase, partial [Chloroflexota bacterium]